MLELMCNELGVEINEEWIPVWKGKNQLPHFTKVAITEDGIRAFKNDIVPGCGSWVAADFLAIHILKRKLSPEWRPVKGDIVWIISLEEIDKVVRREWMYYSSKYDERAFSRGLVFRTKEEAIKAADKVLQFIKEMR